MLLDPAYRGFSLPKLAERVGMNQKDLLSNFRRYQLDRAVVTISRHLPEIAEQMALDARSQWVSCSRCDGLKTIENDHLCPECDGTGEIRQPGDSHAQMLCLKWAGVL